MSQQHHFYEGNHLHFLTASTYRRARLFDSTLFKQMFVRNLDSVRIRLEFGLLGYVLMPEHLALADMAQSAMSAPPAEAGFIIAFFRGESRFDNQVHPPALRHASTNAEGVRRTHWPFSR